MKIARLVGVCFFMVATGVITSATPAAATELGNKTVVYNTDFASFGVGGMRGDGSGTIAVSGVSGTVTSALLYWNGPENSGEGGANASVTFAGHSVTGTNIGTSSDNCWGFDNSQSYRADVGSFVSGNGSYALTDFTNETADINGVSLIVFFNDGNAANNKDVTIVDGNDSNVNNTFDGDGWDATISGIAYPGGAAHLQLHVSDGQSFTDGALTLNGSELVPPGPNFDGDSVPGADYSGNGEGVTGNLWDIKDYTITSFMSSPSTTLHLTSPLYPSETVDDCLSLVTALVDVPSTPADLSVVKTDNPDPVKAGDVLSYTIDVHNSGPSNVGSINVDDTFPPQLSGVTWSCTISAGTGSCAVGSGSGNIHTTVDLNNSATARFFVTGTVSSGATGTISNTATISSPHDTTPANNSSTQMTGITSSSTPDVASGFCTGATTCTISTDTGAGATPGDPVVSTITIPANATADPQSITMLESTSPPTFCGGMPCQGQVLTFTSSPGPTFAGVTDPNHPAVVTMIFDKTVKQGTQIFVKKGAAAPVLVKNCTTAGVAAPHPCVSEKNILLPTGDREFKILFLEGDPTIGKH